MDRFLNLDLMKQPLNWLTVFLMCALALMLLAILSPPPAEAPSGVAAVVG
jgi:hypothetical protein